MGNFGGGAPRQAAGSMRALVCVALFALGASVAACTTGDVMGLQPAVDIGSQTAAVPSGTGLQRLVPNDPYLASYPRPEDPSGGGFFSRPAEPAVMPKEEVDCRRQLKKLRVAYTDIPTIREGACGIDYPVKVTAIGSVEMKPAATLTCDMAATFAQWTKSELVPAARRRYFTGVKTIHQGSSYSCRNIADGRGVLSEHGKGNALDVMRIELNSGRDIDVRKPGLFAFRQRGFLNTVRADGCQYFNTVLGPGYNKDHANHFHFDIKERRNGYVACR